MPGRVLPIGERLVAECWQEAEFANGVVDALVGTWRHLHGGGFLTESAHIPHFKVIGSKAAVPSRVRQELKLMRRKTRRRALGNGPSRRRN